MPQRTNRLHMHLYITWRQVVAVTTAKLFSALLVPTATLRSDRRDGGGPGGGDVCSANGYGYARRDVCFSRGRRLWGAFALALAVKRLLFLRGA